MLADILGGDTGALSRFIVEDYRRRTGDDDLPTNLLTICLRDWIVPGLERANDRLDAVLADPVFFYELSAIRLTLFGKAITLPDVASPEDRGRHDRVEAAVLSAVLHAVEWAFRSVLSYNIDMDIARIDDVLWLIRNGDWGALFGFLGEYPRFLDPSTPETNGIDGRAMLLAAYDDFSTFVLRLRDDDDQDGTWDAIDVRGGIDPGEEADDLIDAFFLDDGLQLWDVLLRTPEGIGINVRVNGEGRRGSELERGLNVALFGLLNSDAAGRIARGVLGLEPPEADARNGIDDDYAVGRSTALAPGSLIDDSAPFDPGTLAGKWLNPNVDQGRGDRPFQRFIVLSNTATELVLAGDPTAVATTGDSYSVGDGTVDDAPIPFGFLLPLLGMPDFPVDAGLGLFYSAFFSRLPSMRDVLPVWDADAGDPDFANFVVDRTESFDDVDGNGRYDPGIDVLHDADHVFGDFAFPADGRYQPYYFYFGDPTWGMLHYSGDVSAAERHDLVNLLMNALVPFFLGSEGR
jgi:hypothetical protein